MSPLRRPELFAATRLAVFALVLSVQAAAQGPAEGALHGSHLQPGVQVAVTSDATHARFVGFTDTAGTFLIPVLAPGVYRVAQDETIAEPALAIRIEAGKTTEFQPPQPDPDLPDTAAPANPDQDGDGLPSFHGLASTQNATSLDGVSADQSFGNVPRGTATKTAQDAAPDGQIDAGNTGLGRGRPRGAPYGFSQASIQEFRVTAQNYTALTGHAAGGLTETVSKRGGDTFHGSVLYELRSSAFAAANPLAIATTYNYGSSSAPVKPADLRQIFGGTLSGPLAKLHFFYAHDQQMRDFPAVSSPGYAGFFTLTAMQTALLANRGVSTAATDAALNYLSGLTGTIPRSAGQQVDFLRFDTQHVGISWNRLRWDSPAGLTSAPIAPLGRASFGNTSGSVDSVTLRLTSVIGSRMKNELRLQYARELQYQKPQPSLPQEPGIGPGGQSPEVDIGPNGLLFGTPANLTRAAYPYERRLQAADTLTWTRGHHTLQLGIDFSAVDDAISSSPNAAGTYRYDSGLTNGKAGGLVDWITDYTFNVGAYPNGGCPSIYASVHYFCFHSFTQSFGPKNGAETVAFATQEWAGFVQETWRIRPGLTVDAGVRYEFQLLPLPQQPNPALDAIFGTTGATASFPEDRNNFGPRFGLAVAPFGVRRLTVRLGYGAFFGRLPGATIAAALTDTALPNSTTHIRITPTVTTGCPQVANQGFGYPCDYTGTPPADVAATSSAVVFDRRFRLPMVQQASFSLEQAFPRRTFITVGYLLNLDRQLPGSSDLNIARSPAYGSFQLRGGTGAIGVRDGETFAIPIYTTRITSSFGPVTDIRSNVDATYNALIATAQTHPNRSLGLHASYTWSKAIDFGQTLGAVPRTNAQFDPFTDRYDKSLSALNYPQAVSARVTWEPTLSPEHRTLRVAASGWLVAPIFTMRSGRPYSLDIYGGNALSGGHESINGSGGAADLPTVGRNTLRLPTTANLNLRLGRDIPLHRDRLRLRLYAETFNLMNHLNLSSVNQRAYLPCATSNPACPVAPVPVEGVPTVTMLLFQNAANIAIEGFNTQSFATPTAAGSSVEREREVQFGMHFDF